MPHTGIVNNPDLMGASDHPLQGFVGGLQQSPDPQQNHPGNFLPGMPGSNQGMNISNTAAPAVGQLGGMGSQNFGAPIDLTQPSKLDHVRAVNGFANSVGRIGNIDMTKPSVLSQNTGFRPGLFGNATFNTITRDSNFASSRAGLGTIDRPTQANAEGSTLRGVLSGNSSNRSLYGNFVSGGVQGTSPSDTLETPGYRSFGTQSMPTTTTRGIQATSLGSIGQSVNSDQFQFGSVGPQHFTNYSAMPSGSYFSGASSAGGGASTASAAAGGPMGIATAIAQKINDVGQAGMDLYNSNESAKINSQYQQRSTMHGMQAQEEASKWYQTAKSGQDYAMSASKLGGQVFGIPGMIAGYALGKAFAPKAPSSVYNTAASPSGMGNPNSPNAVASGSSAGGLVSGAIGE